MLRLHKGFQFNNRFNFGDKSITHRALIFASIAKGKSVIKNANIGGDTLATIRCLRKLGAEITVKKNEKIVVKPIKKPNDNLEFDCKNSGTTARLLAGLVAGLNVNVRFLGDESLKKRPFDRVIEPLRLMGAKIASKDGFLFEISKSDRQLKGIEYTLPVASAQVKSAVLIAGLFANGKTTVVEKIASRNHTENMLRHMKAKIEVVGDRTTVESGRLSHLNITVPNDISTAVFFVAAGILSSGVTIKNVGVNPTRTGAFDVLKNAGADISFSKVKTRNFEKSCDVTVKPSRLKPLKLDFSDVPRAIDEIPILAALACTVAGESLFFGVEELRHKESDRLKAVAELVDFCGQKANIQDVNLTIKSDGMVNLSDRTAETFGDHRLAMTYAILAVLFGSVTLSDANCIDVSSLKFFDILGAHMHNFALVGSGVSQSLSPKLFLHFANTSKLNVGHTLCDLPSDCLDSELFYVFNSFDGVNVTTPFKKRVAKLLHAKTDSINTVLSENAAVSTDGLGIVESLLKSGVKLAGSKILVVGAGATAESAVRALLNEGAKVNIVNRTKEKADNLEKKLCVDYRLDSFDGIVSCIPVCDFENEIPLSDVKFVLSVEYKKESNLLKRACQQNILAIDGLSVLYYQGKKSFELWTGIQLPDTFNEFLTETKFLRNENAENI